LDIYFCHTCGYSIPSRHVNEGLIITIRDKFICEACLDALSIHVKPTSSGGYNSISLGVLIGAGTVTLMSLFTLFLTYLYYNVGCNDEPLIEAVTVSTGGYELQEEVPAPSVLDEEEVEIPEHSPVDVNHENPNSRPGMTELPRGSSAKPMHELEPLDSFAQPQSDSEIIDAPVKELTAVHADLAKSEGAKPTGAEILPGHLGSPRLAADSIGQPKLRFPNGTELVYGNPVPIREQPQATPVERPIFSFRELVGEWNAGWTFMNIGKRLSSVSQDLCIQEEQDGTIVFSVWRDSPVLMPFGGPSIPSFKYYYFRLIPRDDGKCLVSFSSSDWIRTAEVELKNSVEKLKTYTGTTKVRLREVEVDLHVAFMNDLPNSHSWNVRATTGGGQPVGQIFISFSSKKDT